MRSPTTAILWEIWARNRGAIVFAVSLLAVSGACSLSAAWERGPGAAGIAHISRLHGAMFAFSVLAAGLSMVSLFWVFSYTGMDRRGRFTGFPSRLYTLPLRTLRLPAVPIVAGLGAVAAAYAAWFVVLTGITGERGSFLLFGWHLLVLATALVSMQGIVWLLHPFRRIRVVVLVVVCTGCFWMWGWVPAGQFFARPGLCFSLGLLAFAAVVAGTIAGVNWDRRGGWQTAGWIPLNVSPRRTGRRFRSAAHAQVWFEWRRKGVFGAVVLAVVMALLLLLWPLPAFLGVGDSESIPAVVELMTFWSLPLMTLLTAHVLGLAFGKPDMWSPDLELPSFIAVRPITAAALVEAKLQTAARISACAWTGFAGFAILLLLRATMYPERYAFWTRFSESHPALTEWLMNPVVMMTLVVLTWHAMVTGMTATVSGERRRVALHGSLRALGVALLVLASIWLYRRPSHFTALLNVLPWVSALIIILKINVAGFRWSVVRKQHLLNAGQTRRAIVIPLVMVTGIAVAAAHAQRLDAMPAALIWFFAALLLPAGEIVASVVNLHRNRHR